MGLLPLLPALLSAAAAAVMACTEVVRAIKHSGAFLHVRTFPFTTALPAGGISDAPALAVPGQLHIQRPAVRPAGSAQQHAPVTHHGQLRRPAQLPARDACAAHAGERALRHLMHGHQLLGSLSGYLPLSDSDRGTAKLLAWRASRLPVPSSSTCAHLACCRL